MRWILLILLACAAGAQPLDLPKTIQQGRTLRLHAPLVAVAARMNDRTVRLFPQPDGTSFGLLPITAIQTPGDQTIELLDANNAVLQTAVIKVVDAHFPKQNVAMQQSVAELKPSPGESETSAEFRNTVSDVRYWAEPLELPVHGCMTSTYGVQRYLNGKATGDYHGGIDQRSAAGTPIHAAAAGVVKVVAEWNLHGRTVGIDHGQGLETMYLHMSRTAVAEGATVQKGDVIGYVGSTGRATGPHLHWTIYVSGVPVNPLDWVQVAPCPVPKPTPKKP